MTQMSEWQVLQSQRNWYAIQPLLGCSRENQELGGTDPSDHLYEFMICVKSCTARTGTNPELFKKLESICGSIISLCYYRYVGDPNLPTDFRVNEKEKIITLRCKDGYLNLCHKFNQLLHVLRNILHINKSFRAIKGILFIDDDVHVDASKIYPFLKANEEKRYCGHVIQSNTTTSHIKYKAATSQLVLAQVQDFPGLFKHDLSVHAVKYCAGCGFYVRYDTMMLLSDANDLFAPFPSTQLQLDGYLVDNTYSISLCVIDDLNIGAALARLNIFPEDVNIRDVVSW
jgi:hypothetical protein